MHFGIDLGTTNSLIALFRDGKPQLIPNALGDVLTPSVMVMHDGRPVVGAAAGSIALSNPAQSVALFKRAMSTELRYRLDKTDCAAPELSAMILSALKADAAAHLGVTVTDVVILVPASFSELQRNEKKQTGPNRSGTVRLNLCGWPISRVLSKGFPPLDDHSSAALVTKRVKLPTRASGLKVPAAVSRTEIRDQPARGPYSALLRVGLAIPSRLPGPWWALTPPFHHRLGSIRGKPPTPRQSLLCGAFPRVTPAGHYPAPYLHGARTFLVCCHPQSSSHPHDWSDRPANATRQRQSCKGAATIPSLHARQA